jgi:hypothetical protein
VGGRGPLRTRLAFVRLVGVHRQVGQHHRRLVIGRVRVEQRGADARELVTAEAPDRVGLRARGLSAPRRRACAARGLGERRRDHAGRVTARDVDGRRPARAAVAGDGRRGR